VTESFVPVTELFVPLTELFLPVTESIRQEIQIQAENLLETNDLRNLAQSLYRERRKDLPKLPTLMVLMFWI
jgi:hypothetical protein